MTDRIKELEWLLKLSDDHITSLNGTIVRMADENAALRKALEDHRLEYRVIQHWNSSELSGKVNTAIGNGWLPHGGVSIAVAPGGDERFAQAMVKYSEDC